VCIYIYIYIYFLHGLFLWVRQLQSLFFAFLLRMALYSLRLCQTLTSISTFHSLFTHLSTFAWFLNSSFQNLCSMRLFLHFFLIFFFSRISWQICSPPISAFADLWGNLGGFFFCRSVLFAVFFFFFFFVDLFFFVGFFGRSVLYIVGFCRSIDLQCCFLLFCFYYVVRF
jgi:hypothetical protein